MRYLWMICWVVVLGAGSVLGQGGKFGNDDFGRNWPDKPVEDRMPRKGTSWFNRPSADTPAEQLAYARKLLEGGNSRRVRRAFSALVHKWHDSAEAPQAQFEYARLLADAGSYKDAFKELQYLMDYFPAEFPFEKTIDLQYRIANELMGEGRFLYIGMSGEDRALPLLAQIARNAPNGVNIVDVHLKIGAIHENREEFDEAIDVYDKLLGLMPKGEAVELVAMRRAMCFVKRLPDGMRNQEDLERAMSVLASYLRDYPGSSHVELVRAELDKMKARAAALAYEQPRFYEKTGKNGAALAAYEDFIRRFPNSAQAREAAERVQELKGLAGGVP